MAQDRCRGKECNSGLTAHWIPKLIFWTKKTPKGLHPPTTIEGKLAICDYCKHEATLENEIGDMEWLSIYMLQVGNGNPSPERSTLQLRFVYIP